ncbi:acyl carrier protein [Streptomyces nogalater]|uniref:Acyl carrier protein n=1 Tax=Streptomyces nogalater TaxID=38314 RepID=A0ABW0WAG5_STRNO
MITTSDIRAILVENTTIGLPADLRDDTEVVIDSFALTWLKHALETQHGLVIDPTGEDLAGFTSVRAIHDYLRHTHPESTAAPQGGGDGR